FTGRYWRVARDGEGNLFWLSDGEVGMAEQGGFEVVSADGTQFTAMRQDTLGTGSLSVGAIGFDSETAPWERAYVGLNALGTHGLRRWIRSGQLVEPNLPGPQNFTEITLPDSLDVHQFRDIAVSPDQRAVWIAADNGVFEYDLQLQQVRSVLRTKTGARAGLLTGDTKDLQFDNFGNLWVASGKGLNRIRLDQRDPSGLYPVEAFATIETIRNLNAASNVGQLYDPRRTVAPLPAPVVNSLAYDRSRDRLYVGTNGGMAVIDVSGLPRRAQIPIDQAVIYPNIVRLDAPDPARHVFHIGKVSEPVSVTIYTIEGTEVCTSTERDDGDVVWSLGTPDCLQSEGGFLAA